MKLLEEGDGDLASDILQKMLAVCTNERFHFEEVYARSGSRVPYYAKRVKPLKVLDSTRLELSQPINLQPGDSIVISLPEDSEEVEAWQAMS